MGSLVSLIRRIVLVIAYSAVVWHLVDVLRHRSEPSQIFQLYSLPYFAWVVFYGIFWLAWTVITLYAFFRWDWAVARIKHIAQNRRGLAVAWFGLPMVWFAMLGWVTLVGLRSSATTPHSGTVPLVLTAAFILVVLGTLLRYSPRQNSRPIALSLDNRLSGLAVVQQLEKAVEQVAAKNWARLLPLSAITLVTGILCAPALANPNVLIGGEDIRGLYYIIESYATQMVRAGKLPFWNPYLFSGFSLLGRPDSMFFYPFQFVARYFVPVNTALAWGIALHVWIAGVGMFWLCRHLQLRQWIALVCAFAFMIGGGLTTRIFAGHIWKIYALAWMPILWLCLDSAFEDKNRLAVFGGAGVLALIILSGHPTFSGYFLLFAGLYWLYQVAFRWLQQKDLREVVVSGLKFAIILILGVGLASIQLLPSLVFASQASLVSGYGFDEANLGSLVPQHLLMIFLPDAYRQPGQAIWELLPYVGVMLPLTVPWAFVKSRHQRLAFFLGLIAVFSLALGFGHDLRVFSLLYYAFPPFRVMRIPARALVLWFPSIIVLGGIGLQILADKLPKPSFIFSISRVYNYVGLSLLGIIAGYAVTRLFGITLPMAEASQTLLAVATAALMFLALQLAVSKSLLVISWNINTAATWLGVGIASLLLGIVNLPLFIPAETALGEVVWGFTKLVMLLLVGSVLLPLLYSSRRWVIPSILVATFAFADVYSFGAKYVNVSEKPSVDPTAKQVLSVIPPPPTAHIMGGDVLRGSNALMPLHIGNIDGYYSGMIRDYAAYLRGIAKNPPFDTVVLLSNTSFPILDRRALDYLNVTHIFSKNQLSEPGFELAAETTDYFIYKNLNALPRAFWVNHIQVAPDSVSALQAVLDPQFDYRTTVVLDRPVSVEADKNETASIDIIGFEEASGGLTIQTQSAEAGVLVTSEPYYSERRAWIDGEEVPLLKANSAFIAVALPAGSHNVQIGYVPSSLYTGSVISLGALILCLLGVFVSLKKQPIRQAQITQ